MTTLIEYKGELYHAEDFSEDFLAHYGIPGMKWGKRKSKNAHNVNYSIKQRRQDTQHYGKRGSKRINRDMNKGDNLKTARSREVDRHNAAKKSSKRGGRVGGNIGLTTGLATSVAYRPLSKAAVKAVYSNPKTRKYAAPLARTLSDPMTEIMYKSVAPAAMYGIGRDIGSKAPMRARGYHR